MKQSSVHLLGDKRKGTHSRKELVNIIPYLGHFGNLFDTHFGGQSLVHGSLNTLNTSKQYKPSLFSFLFKIPTFQIEQLEIYLIHILARAIMGTLALNYLKCLLCFAFCLRDPHFRFWGMSNHTSSFV